MQKSLLGCSVVLLLAGCSAENPAETTAQDAKDVAMVERMNKAPFKPIMPIGITPEDIARYGLDKPGCAFHKGKAQDALFMGNETEGFMRIGHELKRFSARQEGADLPGNTRGTYIGLSSWIDFIRLPDTETGADRLNWPVRMVIHDAQERVAFTADGKMICRD